MVSCIVSLNSDARHRSDVVKHAMLARRRKGVVMLLLAAGVDKICFDKSLHRRRQAGTFIAEEALWEAGYTVVGRAGNRKRDRMDWKTRLKQIGTETEFRARYKISSEIFARIVEIIRDDVEASNVAQANRSSGGIIKAELHLSMAIRYMAGGDYKDIADMHGVHKNQVYKSLELVTKSINKHYGHEMIFPFRDREACEKLAEGFFKESGETVPGCIGCVDGIVIPIEKPRWGEVTNINDMWNRKGCYAIVCQAICDHQLKFMWLSSSCTGNTNDSLAWECSKLSKLLEKYPLGFLFWLAGDEAYKGSGQVVTPYPGANLSQDRRSFNFYHSRTRIHIERAFGVWKERWGMFHRASCLSLETLKSVIRCSMILHNMCIDNNIANVAFHGSGRELSEHWPGDVSEVIFNDMDEAELRNIVDFPFATREWIRGELQAKGIAAPDPS